MSKSIERTVQRAIADALFRVTERDACPAETLLEAVKLAVIHLERAEEDMLGLAIIHFTDEGYKQTQDEYTKKRNALIGCWSMLEKAARTSACEECKGTGHIIVCDEEGVKAPCEACS